MFLSLDIETTGLDPSCHQIIQIGGVLHTDWTTPLRELANFEFLVRYEEGLYVSPGAYVMNRDLIEKIMAGKLGISYHNAIDVIQQFLAQEIDNFDGKITLAGKNLGSFDLQFLKRLPEFDVLDFGHRYLDPGLLYWNPDTDRKPPSLQECLRRAGFEPEVHHTAKADALDVIKVIRAWREKR